MAYATETDMMNVMMNTTVDEINEFGRTFMRVFGRSPTTWEIELLKEMTPAMVEIFVCGLRAREEFEDYADAMAEEGQRWADIERDMS